MSSSSDSVGGAAPTPETIGHRVLRGAATDIAQPARLDLELRRAPAGAGLGSAVVGGTGLGRSQVERWLDHATAAVSGEIREAARAEGYAAGYAEGRRAAAAARESEQAAHEAEWADLQARAAAAFTQALTAVSHAATTVESRAARQASEIESELTTLAFTLVEALLGRELELARTPGLDAVRRALALAPVQAPVTLRLHPADHAVLSSLPDWAGSRPLTLLPDPTVGAGDCVAQCDAVRIDARIPTALERVREALLGPQESA